MSFRGLSAGFGIALFCGVLAAQESQGTLAGTVTDTQGAVVPKAQVSITNLETNVERTAPTNTSGVYLVPFLTVGRYRVSVTGAGFKKAVRDQVEVRVGDNVEVNFQLEVGAISEQVTVTGETELLETQTASHGQVIDTKSVQDLPLLGRNPFTLTLLSTGVTWANPQPSVSSRPWDNNGMDNFNINGSRGLTNGFFLDGIPNTASEAGAAANIGVVPPPDATAEFKVLTNSYDAEYGRTEGGTVNVSLRSGTNKLHGALYDFERNTVFNANQFQNNANGIPRSAFRWHEPGVRIDGPIYIPKLYDGRNKTFFMANWEGVSMIQPGTVTATVPTLAQRNGDFSSTLQTNGQPITIYDPLSTTLVNGQNVRTAFPGNRILENRIDPVARNLLNFIPLPNVAGTSTGLNNYVVPSYNKVGYNVSIGRIDHSISDKHKLALRALRNGNFSPGGPTGFLGPIATGADFARKNRTGGLDLTSTFSPTLVLVSRVGYSQHIWFYNQPGSNFPLSALGFSPSLISQLPAQTFPQISATNYTTFGPGRNIGSEHNTSSTWSWSETFSKVAGPHSFKFGGSYWVMLNNFLLPGSSFGSFAFTNAWTQQNALVVSASSGNAFASVLLGYPQTGSVLNNQGLAYSSHYYATFLQDDFRVSSRLTLNIGIRWDYESPITERYNRLQAGFDPVSPSPLQVPNFKLIQGGLVYTSSSNRLPFKRDLNNIQPRFGFAYQAARNTVVRGGYAIQYAPTLDLAGSLGFNATTNLTSSVNGGLTPSITLSNPYPGGILQPVGASLGLGTFLGQNISYGDPTRVIPYVHQFSLGVQQLLPFQAVLDISYVGSRTRDLPVSNNINAISTENLALGNALNTLVTNPFAGKLPQAPALNGTTITRQQLLLPFPQFGTITDNFMPIGSASFDSLQVKAEKRYSRGFYSILSYTWSKALQTNSFLNPQDTAPSKTFASFDQAYRMSLSGGYHIPEFANRNWAVRNVLGGWQLNMIGTWQAGRPVTQPDAYPTGIDPSLPTDQRTFARFFNTCTLTATGARTNCATPNEPVAWIVRPAFTLRTSSTYFANIRTPRPFLLDSSLFKEFVAHERYRFQLRFEAFNTTNTVWFNPPGTAIATTTFGVTTPSQANDPRNIQIGAKFLF